MSSSENSDLKRRTVRGVRLTFVSSIVRMLIQSVTLIIMARLLIPADYGIMAAAMIFIQPIQTTLLSGVERAILLKQDMSDEAISSALYGLLAGSVSLCLIVVGGEILLIKEPTFKLVLGLLSFSLILNGICSPARAWFRHHLAFGKIGGFDLAGQVIGTCVVGIPCAWYGLGVYSLVFAILTQGFVQAVLYWFFSGARIVSRVNIAYIKDVAGLSYHVARISLVDTIQGQFLFVFTWYFSGHVELGILNRAYYMIQLPTQMLVNSLTSVLFTGFALVKADPARLTSAVRSLVQTSSIIIFPLTTGMAAAAPQLVQVVLGKRWVAVEPLIPLLAFGTAFVMTGHLFAVMAEAVGELRKKFIVQVSTAAIAALVYAMFSRFGLVGSSAAFAVSWAIYFAGQLLLATNILRIDVADVIRWLVPGAVGSAMVVAYVLGLRAMVGHDRTFFLLSLEVVGCGVTLAATLRLFFGAMLHDLMKNMGLTFLIQYRWIVPVPKPR